MKFSSLICPTLKETPREAEVISHQLMLRAGLIKKVSSGIYTYLPLGLKILKKFESIVRKEMDKISGMEIQMPLVIPKELWEETRRWDKYGKELLRLSDRHEHDYCLGPTHEEVVTDLTRSIVKSYKQLPLLFYQIQLKFRDEIRPRFGLMRGREFIMKDAYSFHDSEPQLERTYQDVANAYHAIFSKCDVAFKMVEADNGSIGGSSSAEFMVLADTGEDAILHCDTCHYAANIEKATSFIPTQKTDIDPLFKKEKIHTPDIKTISDLSQFFNIDPQFCIKSVAYEHEKGVAIVFLCGDDEVNEFKLKNALGVDAIKPMSIDTLHHHGLAPGFMGPLELPTSVKGWVDSKILTLSNPLVIGSNHLNYHLKNVIVGRDWMISDHLDLRLAREKDFCPVCQKGSLIQKRGIEVGHIFKLGTVYSQAMKAQYVNEAGQSQPFLMGCYGIGISRTLAAVIEQFHDEKGIKWPLALSPFQVVLITNTAKTDLHLAATALYEAFLQDGIEVLLDDRSESMGVKFKDANLIGFHFQIVVGKWFLGKKEYELTNRFTGEKQCLSQSELQHYLKQYVSGSH